MCTCGMKSAPHAVQIRSGFIARLTLGLRAGLGAPRSAPKFGASPGATSAHFDDFPPFIVLVRFLNISTEAPPACDEPGVACSCTHSRFPRRHGVLGCDSAITSTP